MTEQEFNNLKVGDIVRGPNGEGWIVTADYLDRKIVTRNMLISNPQEWVLIEKAGERRP